MTDVMPLSFEDHPVRIDLDEQGNPWWVAKDVCEILGISNISDAVGRLDSDEKRVGSTNNTLIINEFGLYSLVLKSRKKKAKEFQRWITHEVLPQIRKTGMYTPSIAKYPELKAIMDLVTATAEARTLAEKAQVAASEARDLAQMAIDFQSWLTIREYTFMNKLERQFPLSQQKEFGRYLTGLCSERNIPVRNVSVADRQWKQEHSYHVETMARELPGWLRRRNGQVSLAVVRD